MNYRVEFSKIQKLLKEFIPKLKDVIVREQTSYSNVTVTMKEIKKINYRIDRLRSDLKLAKETKEKIDVSDSSGIDNGCTESSK